MMTPTTTPINNIVPITMAMIAPTDRLSAVRSHDHNTLAIGNKLLTTSNAENTFIAGATVAST